MSVIYLLLAISICVAILFFVVFILAVKSGQYDDSYTPEIDQFVKLVLEIINTEGIANRITLQSFDIRALESIHAMQSKLETALLIDENESIENKLNQLTYKPDIISPYFKLLSASSVSDYQQKGFKIIPWTLNKIKDINLMIEYQVDGIISDFPDRVIQRLHVN